MKDRNNATCAICGKKYEMCVSCKSHQLTPWKLHVDKVEHYKVFQILRAFFLGVYTKSEAKEKLQTVDLSDMNTYLPDVQNRIHSIMDDVDERNKQMQIVETPKKSTRKKTAKVNLAEQEISEIVEVEH